MLYFFLLWLQFFRYSFIPKEKGKSPLKSLSSLISRYYLIFQNVILMAGHVIATTPYTTSILENWIRSDALKTTAPSMDPPAPTSPNTQGASFCS